MGRWGTLKRAGWGRRWTMALVCAGLGAGARAQGVALPLLPTSVAYDAAGNLYFADTNRHEVYESSLAGVLTVVAGNGAQGYAGDDGAATSAELNAPEGVAVGPDGTLYIADTGNQRIRAVSGGVITTFAGTGVAGFGGDGGVAAAAMLRRPNAVAVDATGALLVSDAGNERVRRISAGVIKTFAGSGVEGFGGDGGPATAALLDTPMGLAVSADGRVLIADSHNDRIRVIATDGTISTFAGSGVRGYSGDGGAATVAALSMPRGVIVTGSGAVLIADSNNQRIRSVNAAGVISTVAGSGVQGAVVDGGGAMVAGMNSPRGVAVSSFGSTVYADALNKMVRESVGNGNVYTPAGLTTGRASTVALAVSVGANEQTSAVVTVTGGAGTPQGRVTLLDGTTAVGQATLSGGTGTVGPVSLSMGPHTLMAMYAGDGVNPAATSSAVSTTVGTGVITATAQGVSVAYGQAIPALTGTLSGVPTQDAGLVTAVFTTNAGAMAAVGSYPITATLTGADAAQYTVVMSPGSGALQVVAASSATTEQAAAQGSYAGLPMPLSASVRATTQGTPTGTVQFVDSGTVVATATLAGGVASGTYLAPSAGTHSIVARYGGNANFQASSSPAMTATLTAMPDFTLATAGSTTQTVASGEVANFGVAVASASAPFTGVVDLCVGGLPTGMTVTFAPPQVVPGASTAAVTMSVQTSAALPGTTMLRRGGGAVLTCLMLPWMLGRRRRGEVRRSVCVALLCVVMVGAAGCGARSVSTAVVGGQTYALTVTGTSTNLAGAVVTHSAKVTLVLQ